MYIFPHDNFVGAALNAVIAAKCGLHVLLEGPSGSGLITIAKFVSGFCLQYSSDPKFHDFDIPTVLLCQETSVENLIGSYKPQPLREGNENFTKLVQWGKWSIA